MEQNAAAFAKGIKASAHKISWPSFGKTMKNTGIVLAWSGILAGIVFLADFASSAGFQALINLAQ